MHTCIGCTRGMVKMMILHFDLRSNIFVVPGLLPWSKMLKNYLLTYDPRQLIEVSSPLITGSRFMLQDKRQQTPVRL